MKKRSILLLLAALSLCTCTAAATFTLAGCEKKPTDIVDPGDDKNPDDGTPDGETPAYYTVTFDANGGSFAAGATYDSIVLPGNAVHEIAPPTREGMDFDYWSLNGERYDFASPVNANLTLVAVYKTASYAITFTHAAGVTVVSDFANGERAEKGTSVSFSLEYGAFYVPEASVTLNGEAISPDDGGVYTFVLNGDSEIAVTGVRKDVSRMDGAGTLSNPYMVEKPVDLIYIAERVNAGDAKYIRACYELAADIDLKGEALDVIGNGKTSTSYFSGYFEGSGHEIRNFVIETDDVNYVGLFGQVIAGVSDDYSATISNLALVNYTITSSIQNNMITVGSIVGYGIGANVYACRVENGVLDVFADDSYFGYVGGIFGIQQSAYSEDYELRCYSSATYTTANVEINVNAGNVLCAGGVTGYLLADEDMTTAYIANCYSDCVVTGAIRSGGIVGYMGNHTSVANCYASGDVNAQTNMSDIKFFEEYCYAFAGGLVGFAECDTIISDSFATGSVSSVADAGSSYAKTGDFVGGSYISGVPYVDSRELIILNCYYAEGGVAGDVDLTSADFIKSKLHWTEADWIFGQTEYPAIRYENTDYSFVLTVKAGGEGIEEITFDSLYMPMSYWYTGAVMPEIIKQGESVYSYGYFFDEQLTEPVPCAYIPSREITLYVGFADNSAIVGTYYLLTETSGTPVELTLRADNTYVLTSGAMISRGEYVYNGREIYMKDARFARYSSVGENDERLQLYTFIAHLQSEGNLAIYDGYFFPEESPLCATANVGIYGDYYCNDGGVTEIYHFNLNFTGSVERAGIAESFTYSVNGDGITVTFGPDNVLSGTVAGGIVLGGKQLSAFDAFKGVWEKSAGSNKIYTIDGMGNWSYEYYGYSRTYDDKGYITELKKITLESASGTYTVNEDGSLTLSNGTVLSEDENGFVSVYNGTYTQTYYRKDSCVGVWTDTYMGVTLTLGGIGLSGLGYAYVEYDNGSSFILTYSSDEDEEIGYISLYSGSTLFGYFYYSAEADMLQAALYWYQSGYIVDDFSLCRFDDYEGDWVSDDDPLFEIVSFDGLGSYDIRRVLSDGSVWSVEGYITINGQKVRYYLENSTLSGYFIYNGTRYAVDYDEATGTVTVTYDQSTAVLERKDEYFGTDLVADDGSVYSFDGRGNLKKGGTLTVTEADGSVYSLTYYVTEGGIDLYEGAEKTGGIAAEGNVYVLRRGAEEKALTVKNYFTGVWAVSGYMQTMTIGKMDLSGTIGGTFLGESVTFTVLSEAHLSFNWNGYTMYVLALQNGGLAVSGYTSLSYGDYILCAPVDELFGEWTRGDATFAFDGMANSSLTYGYALLTEGDSAQTYLYLADGHGGIIIWNSVKQDDRILTYKIVWCGADEAGAFVCGDRAFKLVQIDELYMLSATDGSGVTFTFDGMGTATASDGVTYSYTVLSVDEAAKIALVRLTDESSNTFVAKIDYSDENPTITLTESEN